MSNQNKRINSKERDELNALKSTLIELNDLITSEISPNSSTLVVNNDSINGSNYKNEGQSVKRKDNNKAEAKYSGENNNLTRQIDSNNYKKNKTSNDHAKNYSNLFQRENDEKLDWRRNRKSDTNESKAVRSQFLNKKYTDSKTDKNWSNKRNLDVNEQNYNKNKAIKSVIESNKNCIERNQDSNRRSNIHSDRNKNFRNHEKYCNDTDKKKSNNSNFNDKDWQQNFFQKDNTLSIDVERFWNQLTTRVSKAKSFDLDIEEHKIWLDTWQAAAFGAKGPLQILPIAFLRLPSTTDISPSPIIIVKVLLQVANYIKTNSLKKKSNGSDIHVVNVLESIFDIINLRLGGLIQEDHIQNFDDLFKSINELENVLISTITTNFQYFPECTERLARLIIRKNEIEELKKKLKENSKSQQTLIEDINQNNQVWLGWQQNPKPAKLGWLMMGSWHDVFGLKAKYESSEEYTESLLRLWTLLTFYWGSGAVWPKCSFKQKGNTNTSDLACGEPLLTIASMGECKKCGDKALWKCFRHGHDYICKNCLKRQQDALVGIPGPHASTDIYDAVIERLVLRRGETVFLLKNLESRKPPKIAPNWKTSYRLPISVLVAVVKLSVSREPLNNNSLIQWGEIVPYDIKAGSNQDWAYRSKGLMALRLLNKADCVGMSDEIDSFMDSGVCVAIIDLRVFVPEVISVLNTFSKKDFKDQLDQIPFLDRLIGLGSTQKPLKPLTNDSVESYISYALNNSEIDYIQRLNPITKSKLIQEICSLKPIKSLTGTQLEAFAAALYSSVHCTQGPPGTGKSYIGVCLVLALDLIRKSAELEGHAVGPILVLSYKNHALDEFLNDIIIQYSSSTNSRHYSSLRPGMLIRTGKPDIDSLEIYTERHTSVEIHARDNLERIIMVQRKTRSLIKDFLECARSIEYNPDWIPQFDIFIDINKSKDAYNYSTYVICTALTLYCLMNSYANDILNKENIPLSKKQLIDLSEDEVKWIFKDIAFQFLERLTSNALIIEMNNLNASNFNLIGIFKNLDHWKIPQNQSKIYFYIKQWLNGKHPPPRCKALFDEIQCFEEASENSPFCDFLHNCRSKFYNCVSQRKQNTMFCDEHNCSLNECKFERFKETKFCTKHICPACLMNKSIEIKSRNPFACADHQCIMNQCNKLQVHPYNGYCIDHVCTDCVLNKSEKHLPRFNSNFCVNHKCRVLNCKEKRFNESIDFCSYHLCRICSSKNKINRADSKCPQSQLCEEHRCIQLMCVNQKHDFSSYCKNHSCKECISLKCSVINPSINKAPRNSCKSHSLCQFVSSSGKLCNIIAKQSSFYCNQHQETTKTKKNITNAKQNEKNNCSGKNNKGDNCKANATLNIGKHWYCNAHKNQAVVEVESEKSDSEDDETDYMHNLPLMPVLSNQQSSNILKRIKCNGKFDNDNKCDIFIYSEDDDTFWLCPIHIQLNENNSKKTKNIHIEPEVSLSSIIISANELCNAEKVIEKVNDKLPFTEKKEKKSEIIDEIIDFSEPLSHNLNPDEIDEYYYEDAEEEQENEELKRLKELTEIADYSDEEEKESESLIEEQTSDDKNKNIDSNDLINFENLSWNLSHKDRLLEAAKIIRLLSSFIKRLNHLITENNLATARKNCAEAGAKLFRKARIIGSTVVGASRRLEALRSAEPFAVVIEEACEVIEPTLISVLAVNTLRKLEMIGDHRQLPAFVQQCWFNFETTIPSIKTSLFERLITGQVKSNSARDKRLNAGAILPHTILNEQRRMRSSIADITRPDYNDLVEIFDHQHTSIQCIGDAIIRNLSNDVLVKRLKEHRKTWPDNGRSVPGLSQNIFFWDLLNNSESRPIAGLSACNQNEAEAVSSLTKWLILCGCPPASISIITPYKGQKTAITQALRKNDCLPPFRHDKPPDRGTIITISTVDRYQGDENDIVILSLVRCSPGNRFVGLQNRFVVAMSRARLGFFVIGSVKAVVTNRNGTEGPPHWRRFISSLTQKDENKSENLIRCGNSLPISCPRHNKLSKLNVNKITDFPNEKTWSEFCSLECQTILDRCGHRCKLPCHSPVDILHNKKCNEPLERPCETHASIPLFCHEISIEKNESLIHALGKFCCNIKVDYCRPECGHIVKIACHDKKLLDSKLIRLPDCNEIVSDYFHPVCNHQFKKPKCAEKRKYESKEPVCTTKVKHIHPCKCETEMQCYESIQESINPSICNKSVEIARPRCGHILSMRCNQAEKLKLNWEDQRGKSAINQQNKEAFVYYGENYGPPESLINSSVPHCKVPVTYKMSCGHIITKIQCSTAFEYSTGIKQSPECKNIVSFQCFVCQSNLLNECWLSNCLKSFKIFNKENILNKNQNGDLYIHESSIDALNIIQEFQPKIEKLLPRLCNSKINVTRICSPNHITLIDCYQLLEILMNKKKIKHCNSLIDRILPCKHSMSVQCSDKDKDPPPLCPAKIDETYTYSCGLHKIKLDICSELALLNSTNPICEKIITCTRYRCGHKVTVPCNLKKYAEQFLPGNVINSDETIVHSNIQYCESEREIQRCNEILNYRYEFCGHIRSGVKCFEAFLWASDNEKQPKCEEMTDFKNPVCEHVNKAKCHEIEKINTLIKLNEWNPWFNKTKPKVIEYVLDHDEYNNPIHGYCLKEESLNIKPQIPIGISKETFECKNIFELIRKCGHTSVTTCSNVYWQTYSPCNDVISIECEKLDCKHKHEKLCHLYDAEKRSGKKYSCKNMVLRLCKKCNINKVEVECSQVVIECNNQASFILPCDHEVVWTCGTDEDPRKNPSTSCQSCVSQKWNKIIQKNISLDINKDLIEKLMKKINENFAEFSEIEKKQNILLPTDFDEHNKCRQDIVNRYLTNAQINGTKIEIDFPQSESLADIRFYDIIFIQVEKNFSLDKIDTFYFETENTFYGRGIEGIKLNKASLNTCKSDEDGLIHILIGAAFRFNCFQYSLPFSPTLNKKDKKKANSRSIALKQAGFDCIQTTPDDTEFKKYTYWEPGSCIKLQLISFRICEMCKICLDYYLNKNGYLCSKKHFLCWGCFEQHVTQASKPDSVGKYIDNDGNLLCPECNEKITLLKVAKESIPPKVFDLLDQLKSDLKVKKAVERALKDQEDRLKKEFEKIMAIQDVEERQAERLRLDIIENILTLRCPKCNCAFVDYEGCAALTCGVCAAGFCAFCLKHCGSDAHAHVPNCNMNQNREMFISPEKFNKHHSIRRENLIKEKLNGQTDKVKNLICNKMGKDFRDLGIQINLNNDNSNSSNNKSLNGFFGLFRR